MSEVFKWSPAFLTGLDEVDAQHQRLVELINRLGAALTEGSDVLEQEAAATQVALLDYSHEHFRDEELMFVTAGVDPRHVEYHRREHQTFIDEIQALAASGQSRPAELIERDLRYLVSWLGYHILGVDWVMARQVQLIEQGVSPAQAFETVMEDRQRQAATEPLLAALNSLLSVVSARNRELAELNRTLEQRVVERTAELVHANERLNVLTYQDDLTGLYNRRYALSALQALWLEARQDSMPLSVLMLDADRFKSVNDSFGHAEGDAVLKALGERLRDAVRTSDIVCRLGGDEFLVICPRSDAAGTALVADKILAARRPYVNAGGTECWNGSVSIGIAEVTSAMRSPEDMLQAADRALYEAKRVRGSRAG